MASKVKSGMGGSNGGRGRREPTAVLKTDSKKRRRALSDAEIALEWEGLEQRERALIVEHTPAIIEMMTVTDAELAS